MLLPPSLKPRWGWEDLAVLMSFFKLLDFPMEKLYLCIFLCKVKFQLGESFKMELQGRSTVRLSLRSWGGEVVPWLCQLEFDGQHRIKLGTKWCPRTCGGGRLSLALTGHHSKTARNKPCLKQGGWGGPARTSTRPHAQIKKEKLATQELQALCEELWRSRPAENTALKGRPQRAGQGTSRLLRAVSKRAVDQPG